MGRHGRHRKSRKHSKKGNSERRNFAQEPRNTFDSDSDGVEEVENDFLQMFHECLGITDPRLEGFIHSLVFTTIMAHLMQGVSLFAREEAAGGNFDEDKDVYQKKEESQADIAIVSRKEWRAMVPKNVLYTKYSPFRFVFLYCINGRPFAHPGKIIPTIQALQSRCMLRTDDILSHFVVGNDAKVYEGRGWDYKGEIERTINIDFIVSNIEDVPTRMELEVCKKLIQEGVKLGKILENYCLVTPKTCRLYDELVSWKNFSPINCPDL